MNRESTASADVGSGGRRRLLRTFLSLIAADAVLRVLSLGASLIMIRSLAPRGYGSFSYALALAGILSLTMDFGLSLLLIRDISSRPADSARLLGACLVAVGCVGSVSLVLILALVLGGVLTGPAGTTALLIAFGAAAADAFTMGFEAALIGHGQAGWLPVGRAARGTILVLGTSVAAVANPVPEMFLAVSLGGSTVNAATAGLVCASRAVRPRFEGALREAAKLLRRSLPFAVLAGSTFLYSRIDLVMVGAIAGAPEAGQYGVAIRVLETVMLVPIFFGSAFQATISHRTAEQPTAPATPERIVSALRASLLISVPCSLILAVGSPAIIGVVAGRRYHGAEILLTTLSPVVALVGCYGVLSNLQLARDQTKLLLSIAAVGAGLKVVANALLIPGFGARGAAWAVGGAEAFLVLTQWWAARHELKGVGLGGWMTRFVTVVVATVVVTVILGHGLAVPWPVNLTAGLLVLLLGGLLVNVVRPRELWEVWTTISPRRSQG